MLLTYDICGFISVKVYGSTLLYVRGKLLPLDVIMVTTAKMEIVTAATQSLMIAVASMLLSEK